MLTQLTEEQKVCIVEALQTMTEQYNVLSCCWNWPFTSEFL